MFDQFKSPEFGEPSSLMGTKKRKAIDVGITQSSRDSSSYETKSDSSSLKGRKIEFIINIHNYRLVFCYFATNFTEL